MDRIEIFSLIFPVIKKELGLNLIKDEDVFKYSVKELLSLPVSTDYKLEVLSAERFFFDALEDKCIKSPLLEKLIEFASLSGLLVKTEPKILKEIFDDYFFECKDGIYFLPGSTKRRKSILKKLFKSKKPFTAVEAKGLNSLNSLLLSLEDFKTAEIFDLSVVTELGKLGLEHFFGKKTPSELAEILKKLRGKSYLYFVEGENIVEVKDFLMENCEVFELLEDKVIATSEKNLTEELKKFSESLGITAGVLTQETYQRFKVDGASELLYLLAALEHARRLENENFAFFEGFSFHVLGDMFYEWGDLVRALKYYQLAEPFTKQPVELILSQSAVFYELDELEKAESLLKAGICIAEKDPAVYYNLGLIYRKKRDLKRAKIFLEKACKLSEGDPLPREAYLEVLWRLKDYEKLKKLLESKKLSPKEAIVLGKVYFKEGRLDEAFELLKRGTTAGEKDGEALVFLAHLYKTKGEKGVAEVLLKESEEMLGKEKVKALLKEVEER